MDGIKSSSLVFGAKTKSLTVENQNKMNRSVVFAFLAAFILGMVSALPAVENFSPWGLAVQEEKHLDPLYVEANDDEAPADQGTRFRRVTCDILSVSLPIGSLNHSACAIRCMFKRRGYKGGRCKDGVCHCRK